MNALDNLIQKVGNDKTLHFLGGGFICSFISFIVILQESGLTAWEKVSSVLIGTVFVLILSVLEPGLIHYHKPAQKKGCLCTPQT
jgi:hypothetical protein